MRRSLAALAVVLACGGDENAPGGGSSSGASSSSGGSSSGGSSSGGPLGPGTMHGGCRIFPNDNPWNTDASSAAIDADLTATLDMAPSAALHPDWGALSANYGIPINVGPAATPVPITWRTTYGPRESDKNPCPGGGGGEFCYPIPLDAKIEGGSNAPANYDRHILFLATDGAPDRCVLWELFNAQNPTGGGFAAASGARWPLDTNARRPEGWTSADAAGLPVLAGLVRREEIERGAITHALRFTMSRTRQAYIHPATHAAGIDDASLPPMGLRVRLKASYDDAQVSGPAKVVTTAMKKYGMILADNGSNWYVTGESHESWSADMDDLLRAFRAMHGSDFEIVKTGPVIIPPP